MNFRYRGRDAGGSVVEGQVEAESQGMALETLRQRGVVVLSMNAGGVGAARAVSQESMSLLDKLRRIGTVSGKTKMVFFRQLATMIKAGLSLTAALDIISEQERNLVFKDVLLDVKANIDRGVSLSQAMKQHKVFNVMMTSLVQAGEEGGLLDESLERVAGLLEKQAALVGKIKSAMFYPSFVILFAISVVVVFIAFILPKFKQVFEGMKIKLPALTEMMFQFGEYCQNNWKLIVGVTFAVIAILVWLLRSPTTKPFMDRLKLRTPVIKSLVFKSCMARSTQTLASLVSAGVPILRSLEMAEEVAGNDVIRVGFADLQASAKSGLPLGDAARHAKVFPPLVCQMMRIGEETGHLDEMLERVAAWYDQELDEQIKAMTSLMEPVMIVIVGGIVALIAMAIFGPITSIMSSLD